VLYFKNDIKPIKVPKFAELKTSLLIEELKEDADVQRYLPDLAYLKKKPDREWLYNVLHTRRPQFVE